MWTLLVVLVKKKNEGLARVLSHPCAYLTLTIVHGLFLVCILKTGIVVFACHQRTSGLETERPLDLAAQIA